MTFKLIGLPKILAKKLSKMTLSLEFYCDTVSTVNRGGTVEREQNITQILYKDVK